MKKTLFILVILVLSLLKLSAQNLSENVEISIITCAPGEELYSAFGHSAIRINDKETGIDLVYNYGTFDFDTPNFYLKFMGGRLDYMLSVVPFRYFIIEYSNQQRWVKAQVLNLTANQKQKIFGFLQNNARPENKFYRYDFFFDNCATRIKDVVRDALGDELKLGTVTLPPNASFRDLIQPYLVERQWGRFGINLGLGMPTDRIATVEESTFLPDYLNQVVGASKVMENGIEKPLVISEIFVYKPEKENIIKAFPLTPQLLFYGFLLIVVLFSLFEFRSRKTYFVIDSLLFFFTGLVGIVILILWTATEHTTVVNNWNLIWALPTHFIMAFFLVRRKRITFIRYYFGISAFLAVLGLIFLPFCPQGLDSAILPIILAELIRSTMIWYRITRK